MHKLLSLSILLICAAVPCRAATFQSVTEAPNIGWAYTFSIKTKDALLPTKLTIYTKNCYSLRSHNFVESSREMAEQNARNECFYDEDSARAYAQKSSDDDEIARSTRGESSTMIEANRLKQKLMN